MANTIRQITFDGVGGLKAVPSSKDYVANLKYDGSQYHLHIKNGKAYGLTSKRISKKTGELSEKIDHFPNINDQKFMYKKETIIVVEVSAEHLENVAVADRCTHVSGIMNSNVENMDPNHNLKMIAHDVVYYEGKDVRDLAYQERTALLKGFKFAGKYGEKIATSNRSKVTVYRVENIEMDEFPFFELDKGETIIDDEAIQQYVDAEEFKFEGLIFKHLFSGAMKKFKKIRTVDCIIMGFVDSKSEDKYAGMVGSLRVGLLTDRGVSRLRKKKLNKVNDLDKEDLMELINCEGVGEDIREIATVSGFDEDQREDFTLCKDLYYGTIVEVSYMQWTGDRLRHPRFEKVRYDKQIERCTFEQVL